MPTLSDLAGRCAVVTGAARGIGLAIAKHLLLAGARVVAVDKDGMALKKSFAEQAEYAERTECIEHDLGSCDDDSGAVPIPNGEALAKDILGMVKDGTVPIPSLIVNNAGIETLHGFRDLETSAFDEVFRTNFRTPVHLTRTLVNELLRAREQKRDSTIERAAILFISSVHASVPSHRPHYSASKAAIEMLTKELAVELGPHGIRVNAIAPGWICTDPDPTSPEQRAKRRALVPRIPLGRPGTPDDVAKLALWMLSDQCASYVTGVSLVADGGLSLDTWLPPPDSGWEARPGEATSAPSSASP